MAYKYQIGDQVVTLDVTPYIISNKYPPGSIAEIIAINPTRRSFTLKMASGSKQICFACDIELYHTSIVPTQPTGPATQGLPSSGAVFPYVPHDPMQPPPPSATAPVPACQGPPALSWGGVPCVFGGDPAYKPVTEKKCRQFGSCDKCGGELECYASAWKYCQSCGHKQ